MGRLNCLRACLSNDELSFSVPALSLSLYKEALLAARVGARHVRQCAAGVWFGLKLTLAVALIAIVAFVWMGNVAAFLQLAYPTFCEPRMPAQSMQASAGHPHQQPLIPISKDQRAN